MSLIETDISLVIKSGGPTVFQFELLTKRDWALVVLAAALMAVILGGGLYWMTSHYSGVSISADRGKLGRY